MKYLEVIEPKAPVTILEIENAEKEIGISFPKIYKDFLLKVNGGHPDKDTFPMLESYNEKFDYVGSSIAWFNAICNDEYSNLVKDCFGIGYEYPKDLMPIASDPGGNIICLGISGEVYGKVYFWDIRGQAAAFGVKEPWYRNVYLIANSFEDFINSLYNFDLEDRVDGGFNDVSTHDEYSLKFCNEGKRYGNKVFEFFERSPKETQDFVIKEYTKEEIIELSYKDEKAQKQYFREIHKASGEIIREYERDF